MTEGYFVSNKTGHVMEVHNDVESLTREQMIGHIGAMRDHIKLLRLAHEALDTRRKRTADNMRAAIDKLVKMRADLAEKHKVIVRQKWLIEELEKRVALGTEATKQ